VALTSVMVARRHWLIGISLLGAVGLLGAVAWLVDARHPDKHAPRLVAVDIAYSDIDLRLQNQGSADWTTAIVYINGDPPNGFKHTVAAPKVGSAVTIPFAAFVDASGRRFDPTMTRLKNVWVGGKGYDFQGHTVPGSP
jgi:hypothetical protein